jgi:hypothetical protein
MSRLVLSGILLALTSLLWTGQATARLLESWPYERLFKEADLVVIAKAVAVADSGEKTTDNPWKVEFQGVTTTFEAHHVLKGKVDKKLKVLHFRLKDGQDVRNGLLLVSFRLKGFSINTKTMKAGVGTPEYLLFLKTRSDGRYEPVSGRVDPELSVREVYSPLPMSREERRR